MLYYRQKSLIKGQQEPTMLQRALEQGSHVMATTLQSVNEQSHKVAGDVKASLEKSFIQ